MLEPFHLTAKAQYLKLSFEDVLKDKQSNQPYLSNIFNSVQQDLVICHHG